MTWKPLCHVRILIYRTLAIRSYIRFSLVSLHKLNDAWAPRRLIADWEKICITYVMYIVIITVHSYLCFEKIKSSGTKNVVIKLEDIKNITKVWVENCIAPCKESKTVLECGLHNNYGANCMSQMPCLGINLAHLLVLCPTKWLFMRI